MEAAICSERNLGRIVALLVALAVLAERAAGRSLPVRWFILAVLRRAEAVARAFVAEATLCGLPDLGEHGRPGSGRADAMLLAAQFRTMAALLASLLPAPGPFRDGTDPLGSLAGRFAPRLPVPLAADPAGRAGGPNDTS